MLNQDEIKTMNIITKNAAAEASKVFSKWLRSEVTISMEQIDIIPFETIAQKSGDSESVSIGLYLRLEEGLHGGLLFLFSEQAAFKLIDILLKKPFGTTKEFGELEKSALNETANIVGCAYINSLGGHLKTKVKPSPPLLLHDLTESIMSSILMEQAAVQNESIFIETEFNHDSGKLDWNFFFLPEFESLKNALSLS